MVGTSRRRSSDNGKNSCADDCANAKCDKVNSAERAFEMNPRTFTG
jgi:hypothetical protein